MSDQDLFTAFVPTGNAINPNTGGNWEGKGVIPDLAGPEGEGFVLAYRAALTKLAGQKRGRSVDRETETTLAAMNRARPAQAPHPRAFW